MIHVLTVHHRSPRWIAPQLAYLERTMSAPYRVYGSLEGIDADHAGGLDEIIPTAGRHAGKLNHMARVVVEAAPPDDLLMFLDGDAFPVVDPMPVVRAALGATRLVAVRRAENLGDPQPHPCFCVTTVGFWAEIDGDWSNGYPWHNERGELVSDVGGNLRYQLERAGASWTPLLRTNRENPHPVWFAIYGGIVYHHGAGFRSMMSRHDRGEMPPPARSARGLVGRVLRREVYRMRRFRRERESVALSERIFTQLSTDPEFYRQFI